MAEQSEFIKGFLRGTASCDSYLQLLVDLKPVYVVMEREIKHHFENQTEFVESFYFPEIFRASALERDIVAVSSLANCYEPVVPSEASQEYAGRIQTVSRQYPILLIAHLYTRYLGDLSGGQILSRIAQRSMGLSVGNGLDFYDFDQVQCLRSMKQRFRNTLDFLDTASAEERSSICREADLAFRYNIKIFEGLRGEAFVSLFRNLPFINRRPLAV